MVCPHCSAELKLEGEFHSSEVEVDNTDVVGTVTITFSCAECNEELGEYDIELEQDITDFAADHCDEEDHDLSVELDDESFDEHKDENDGKLYPGATAAVNLSCACGKSVSYLWSNYDDPVEVIKALL